jgi:hypothetical protein
MFHMTMTWNRILSGLLAVIYIVMAFAGGGGETGLKVVAFVILPLACIWFGDEMGGYIGPTWGAGITAPSPGLIVCIAGWLLLLLPIIAGVIAIL